ncbi:nesprin-2-like [Agrilus planipennis]|uniref:Nesprin-2-like n=1 Tax=Agrilus planipennis TaxID=224129 RepID=A0A7F5REX9_AGRPL|nr:nesprin-2-like [Agrilus planipennis]
MFDYLLIDKYVACTLIGAQKYFTLYLRFGQLLDQASSTRGPSPAPGDSNDTHTGDDDGSRISVLRRSYHFLGRVVRASLPIQAMMLLLLGAASLVPTTQDDYSCLLVNNFANSFTPMLRYNDGPPPL